MNALVRAGLAALTVAAAIGVATGVGAQGKKPEVAGEWVGTWGVSNPAADVEAQIKSLRNPQMRLDCKVEEGKDGKWSAVFEGECGRPYKYSIKMLGRQAGESVLFQGTADLGKEDGGVYDWIGKATEKEFVGFYTSQKYTGSFQLKRPVKAAAGG